MFRLSKRSIHNMKDVSDDIVMVFMESIKVTPIDFGIPNDGGVRSTLRQHQMYLDPNISTRCDGYDIKSNHQIPEGEEFGEALDYYAYINGKASWDKIHLAIIAGVLLSTAKRLKDEGKISITLKWGGTFGSKSFKGWDYPHVEKE